jgi:phosphohistidine swiveling domain-containing protein
VGVDEELIRLLAKRPGRVSSDDSLSGRKAIVGSCLGFSVVSGTVVAMVSLRLR